MANHAVNDTNRIVSSQDGPVRLLGYHYVEVERELNDYGSQGWEMVSTITPSFGAGQAIEVAVVMKQPA